MTDPWDRAIAPLLLYWHGRVQAGQTQGGLTRNMETSPEAGEMRVIATRVVTVGINWQR